MEKELDELLKHALSPKDEPDFWLNQRILNQAKEQRTMIRRKKRIAAVATFATVLLLCFGSVTAYAAWKYRSASDIAENVQDIKLAEAFSSEQAVSINETQCYGGYRVTLLGMISGESLSEYSGYSENTVAERTYAVIAIENADGTPMPDTSEEAYLDLNFCASPLIGGYNPILYNIGSMSGSYVDMTEDGILYRLLECDNVEIFADHKLYVCVSDGRYYNVQAYYHDESTGQIFRNETYQGLNALFDLPMDASKANPEKAAEYIESLGFESDISEEKLNVGLEESFEMDVQEGNEKGYMNISELTCRMIPKSKGKWESK